MSVKKREEFRMKKRLICLMAMLMALCLSACGDKNNTEEEHDHEHESDVKIVANLRIGVEAHEGQPQYESAVRFAKEVEAKSEGTIKATVYGAGKLGTDEELLKYLDTEEDAIDIVVASASAIAEYKPGFNVAELPFAMRNYDDVREFVNSDAQRYAAQGLEEHNMRALAYYMDSFHVLVCGDQKVSTAQELQNSRVVAEEQKLATIALKAMGAQVQNCDYEEMYDSLQSGRYNVAAGRIEDIYNARVYRGQEYLVLTNHSFELYGAVISENLWNKLDAEYQQIIQAAATSSSHYNIEEVRQADRRMIGEMESAGIRVVEPNPESFWEKAEPAVRNYSVEFSAIADRLIMWKQDRQ